MKSLGQIGAVWGNLPEFVPFSKALSHAAEIKAADRLTLCSRQSLPFRLSFTPRREVTAGLRRI
jgi:hypothetical protein